MLSAKRLLASATAIGLGAAAIVAVPAAIPAMAASASFDYTGSNQSFTVPTGVTEIEVLAYGASGASGSAQVFPGGAGSLGAYANFNSIPVTPGETLTVRVGGMGAAGEDGGLGGFGGGGDGTGGSKGGGGGGASTIYQFDGVLTFPIIVAAGGAGGGGTVGSNVGGDGGAAGDPVGGTGVASGGNLGGSGATQDAGGAGGVTSSNPGEDGLAGALEQGGNGSPTYGGGGGGGGYFGGGGGSGSPGGGAGGGGGGSSYSVSNTGPGFGLSQSAGNGSVVISWALAPPVVTATTPSIGSTGGGTHVVINGSSFVSGATVKIGGAVCDNPVVASASRITCVTRAHSKGVTNVVVTNPDDQTGTLSAGYTYATPRAQVPLRGCVTPPPGHSFSGGSSYQLMKPNCRTNANQRVGAHAYLLVKGTRGDVGYLRLYCQRTGYAPTRTAPTGYGDGSRYCPTGAMRIATGNSRVLVGITWWAPHKGVFNPYSKTKAYRVR